MPSGREVTTMETVKIEDLSGIFENAYVVAVGIIPQMFDGKVDHAIYFRLYRKRSGGRAYEDIVLAVSASVHHSRFGNYESLTLVDAAAGGIRADGGLETFFSRRPVQNVFRGKVVNLRVSGEKITREFKESYTDEWGDYVDSETKFELRVKVTFSYKDGSCAELFFLRRFEKNGDHDQVTFSCELSMRSGKSVVLPMEPNAGIGKHLAPYHVGQQQQQITQGFVNREVVVNSGVTRVELEKYFEKILRLLDPPLVKNEQARESLAIQLKQVHPNFSRSGKTLYGITIHPVSDE